MAIPFVIDNQANRLANALNELLAQSTGKPLDIATAYFAISGYRLVNDGLHQVGAFRLLLGAEPHAGADVGLKPNALALKKRLQGDLEAEPFNEATLKLVEELIAFLRADKVEVRLYDKGFLHAKAYLFHQDNVGPHNRADRLRPFAAIVGSSNFTGPGLVSNRELNLVHRVILRDFLSCRAPARTVGRSAPSRRRWRKGLSQMILRRHPAPKSAAPTVRGCTPPRPLLLRKSRQVARFRGSSATK